MNNKKAQVTIFIIIALVIIAAAAIIFVSQKGVSIVPEKETPISQIKRCVQDSAQQDLLILASQGGLKNPTNYYLSEGNKINYLCYTEEFYKPCVMQYPLIKQTTENELANSVKPKIMSCIGLVKTGLEKQGYSVSYKEPLIKSEFVLGKLLISLSNIDLKITKDQTENYESIKTEIDSGYYKIFMIVSSILNWETRYGDSESMIYMMNYPSLKIEKKIQSEGTKLYAITQKDSNEKFTFAVKSYVIPTGITGD